MNSIQPLAGPKAVIHNKFNQISLKTDVCDCFSGHIKENNLNNMPNIHGCSPSTEMLVIIPAKPFPPLSPMLALAQLQIIVASARLFRS